MLNIVPVKQKKSYWCGPASLKMVLSYHGIDKSEKELADLTQASPQTGVTDENLISVAKTFGLSAFIKDKSELEDIRHYVLDQKIPIIVDWFQKDDGHYSVVVDINDKYLYLIDPYVGQVTSLKLRKFYRLWFDFPGEYLRSNADLTLRRLIVIYS